MIWSVRSGLVWSDLVEAPTTAVVVKCIALVESFYLLLSNPILAFFCTTATGKIAKPKQFPFYVLLGACGGSLLAPDVVLTAAHCKDSITQGNIVWVGPHLHSVCIHMHISVVQYIEQHASTHIPAHICITSSRKKSVCE